jgi:hypothetical protein
MRKLLMFGILIVCVVALGAAPLFAPTDRNECDECEGEWECVEPHETVVSEDYLEGLQTENDSLWAQIDELNLIINGLESSLSIAHDDITSKNREIERLRTALADVEDYAAELQNDLDVAYADVADLETAVSYLGNEIERLEDVNAALIAQLGKKPTGPWVGVTTGYPFGALGNFSYQFSDRFMFNSGIGYMGGFQIQAGLSLKIGG